MKRILFLNHLGVVGGAELELLDLARHYRRAAMVILFSDGPFRGLLEEAGVVVKVLPSRWAREGTRGCTTRPSPRSLAEVALTIARVARIARVHDVLVANSQKALIVGSAASVLARRPLVSMVHEILNLEHFSRWNARMNVGLANRFAACILANSRASALAHGEWGGRMEKVHVAYCGFDRDSYGALSAEDAAAARASLGLPATRLVGLFGRITPWKGHHVLLEALLALPGVEILIAGDATDADREYQKELRERARRLGIADRVHFVGFEPDVARLMQLVDVVAHTSVAAEPFGRVLVEAMLSRRPVIATRGGGVGEIVQDGVTGLLVEPGCPAELARAIARILDDPPLARRLADAAHALARRCFGLETMIDTVDRHLEEAATSSTGAA